MNINNYIFGGIAFLAGAAVSGITTWVITKKRFEKIHNDEMKKVWDDLQGKPVKENNVKMSVNIDTANLKPITDKPDLAEYANHIREQNYSAPVLPKTDDFIFEIGENDIDEDTYERIELTLYADGIITDDKDYPMRDPETYIGKDYLTIMHGKDEAFIRNEKLKIDYDICRSMLAFGEMLSNHPEVEQRLQYNDALDDYYERDGENEDSDEYEEDDED